MKTFLQFVGDKKLYDEHAVLDPHLELYHNPSGHQLEGLLNRKGDSFRALHSHQHGLFVWPASKDRVVHDVMKDDLSRDYGFHFPKGDVHPFYIHPGPKHPSLESAVYHDDDREEAKHHAELVSRLKNHPATKKIVNAAAVL